MERLDAFSSEVLGCPLMEVKPEVYREEVWGAVDPAAAVIYRHANGRLATTWELMSQPELVQAHESPQAR